MGDCFCDFDAPTCYAKTVVTARKAHKCSECFGEIGVGETYERVFGVWDGNPDTFKTCCRCLALRDFIERQVPCFCWQHGNMIQDALDTADDYYEQGNGLKFGALRRKVLIERHRQVGKTAAH